MKAKQIKNKLILTWEKDDEIKVGETITIDLSDIPEIDAIRNIPDNFSRRKDEIIVQCIFCKHIHYLYPNEKYEINTTWKHECPTHISSNIKTL